MEPVNGLSSEAVRTQLRRIMGSRDFDASERNHRFLEHVVTESLAGRSKHIKAYSIATTVYGRDSNFDAMNDPIVRIEASRLRRSLEHYYLTAGKDDPLRIEIPRGGYVPTFRSAIADQPRSDLPVSVTRKAASPVAGSFATTTTVTKNWWWRISKPRIAMSMGLLALLLLAGAGIAFSEPSLPFSSQDQAAPVTTSGPTIFVAPFDNDGESASDNSHVRGFTREVVVGLTRYDALFVYGPEITFPHVAGVDPKSGHDFRAQFLLSGGVTISEKLFRAAVSLVDTHTGRSLWSGTFERDVTARDVIDARESVANQIVQILAEPNGILIGGNRKRSVKSKDNHSLFCEAAMAPAQSHAEVP